MRPPYHHMLWNSALKHLLRCIDAGARRRCLPSKCTFPRATPLALALGASKVWTQHCCSTSSSLSVDTTRAGPPFSSSLVHYTPSLPPLPPSPTLTTNMASAATAPAPRERRPSTSAPINDFSTAVGPPGMSRPKHKRTATGFGPAEIKAVEASVPEGQRAA